MVHAKQLTTGKTVSTIKLAHDDTAENRKLVTAIYALTGGYNQVARGVDLEEYGRIHRQFVAAVYDMQAAIKAAESLPK